MMVLRLIEIVNWEYNARSFKDRRHKVTRATAAYRGEDGYEYRKGFERRGKFSGSVAPPAPIVPESGTHAELNALAHQ